MAVVLLVTACGPAVPAVEGPPTEPSNRPPVVELTTPPASATTTPLAEVTAPAAAATTTSTPAAPSSEAALTPGSSAPHEPAADPCAGARLDLDEIVSKRACRARGKAAPPPAAISIRTEPAELLVATGGHVDFAVVFTNKGSAPASLDLEVGCGRFTLEAYDRAGKRADYINTTCGFGTGCGRGLVRVNIAPGGTLRKALGFDAKVTTLDASCHDTPGGPMKAGKYELRVWPPATNTGKPFDFRMVKTRLTVQ